MAISELFDIDEVRVYDINPEASKKYAEDMKDTVKGDIVIARTPEEASQADVVVCVTQSKDKFVKNAWLKPGTILFPMGSYQECEDEFILEADRIIVDHVGQCLHRGALKELSEAGKITEKNIYATIGELVAGKKKGRESESERVLCIPIGTGAMDIAVAATVLERAEKEGIGGSYEFA
jgi:ornithine cyclodeaminase/alanine dehydrogenase